MTVALFRQEAIDNHRAKIWGEVTLSMPLSLGITTVFLAVCVLAVAIYLAVGSYARKEHVSGLLAPSLGVARVAVPRSGTITVVHVVEGQIVAKGAPLLTVSAEQATDRGDRIDTALLASMQKQRTQLEDQIKLEERKFVAEADRLQGEITNLTGELADMQRERDVQQQRTKVAYDQMASVADLTRRGVISQAEYKKRQDSYLAQQQGDLSVARSTTEKRKELTRAQNDLKELPIDKDQRVSKLKGSIGDIDIKLKQTEGQRAYLVSAPMAGRISALQAITGKTADPAIPQMSIVPEGDTLSAELFVPARAIGFVAPGQMVHLHYAAFPYQQFGFGEGKIMTISQTLLKPEQFTGPIAFTGASYRVVVALTRQTVYAYGKEMPLQADMQLEADILFDRRSLLAWILDPLMGRWRHS